MTWLSVSRKEPPARQLRNLLAQGDSYIVPGVFNPLVALAATRAGFRILYLSGGAFSASLGLADLGLVTLTELAEATARITTVTPLPLIVDADTGFGEPLNVARTVHELERAGAAAIQIEDQVMPKKCGHLSGKRIIAAEEMIQKIRAAVHSRRTDLVIIARTDARATHGLEEAIERARAYIAAGADVIFPEALQSEEEFARFAREVPVPLLANMTEFGKTPYISAARFAELGYQLVLFPVTALRVAMHAIEAFFATLAEQGSQVAWLDRMQTRAELYELIHYDAYTRFDQTLVQSKPTDIDPQRSSGGTTHDPT
ncbi:MAG: methylisocitrate lyase [Nitrospinota bacterium]|nr:MAG: methylisocitrate lyase [Nitrospinota bacterium]